MNCEEASFQETVQMKINWTRTQQHQETKQTKSLYPSSAKIIAIVGGSGSGIVKSKCIVDVLCVGSTVLIVQCWKGCISWRSWPLNKPNGRNNSLMVLNTMINLVPVVAGPKEQFEKKVSSLVHEEVDQMQSNRQLFVAIHLLTIIWQANPHKTPKTLTNWNPWQLPQKPKVVVQ